MRDFTEKDFELIERKLRKFSKELSEKFDTKIEINPSWKQVWFLGKMLPTKPEKYLKIKMKIFKRENLLNKQKR